MCVDVSLTLEDNCFLGSPEMLVQLEHCERHGNQCNLSDNEGNSQLDNMDTGKVTWLRLYRI